MFVSVLAGPLFCQLETGGVSLKKRVQWEMGTGKKTRIVTAAAGLRHKGEYDGFDAT